MTRIGMLFLACGVLLTATGCGRGSEGGAGGPGATEAVAGAERLLAEGREAEAEKAYEDIARRWPKLVQAHVNLAYLRLRAGDAEAAVTRAQRALELDAESVAALTTLGGAYLELGPEFEDKAVVALEKAVSVGGGYGSAEAQASLAAVYYRRGNLAAAIASARSALGANPTLEQAQYNLAVALEAQADGKAAVGRNEEAGQLRKEALGHYKSFAARSKSPEAKEAQAAAERLDALVGGSGASGGTGAAPGP